MGRKEIKISEAYIWIIIIAVAAVAAGVITSFLPDNKDEKTA